VKAFFRILARWKVPDEAARDLLGGISHGTFYNLRSRPKTLRADELLRVSYLIGIFKALNILYSDKLADAWIQLPNTNPIFKGDTPLAYVRAGGIPALQTVRRLLDARRGGS
jgi:antitoxin Xre/MbcA/ParS-like protein